MCKLPRTLTLALWLLPVLLPARQDVIFRPAEGANGMVVAAERRAAAAGLAVLERGGNAVDAAVATGFALAVTFPEAGNIGGGGFMLIHDHANLATHALDYRETAPQAASRDMFLGPDGNPDPALSQVSPLSAGVPGTVAGLLAAHERFGSLPLAELLAPAIALARDGFTVEPWLVDSLLEARAMGKFNAAALEALFKADGQPYAPGETLRQPDLAATLERIAQSGRDGFYTGPTAEALIATLAPDGGIMTLGDLAAYQPVWRDPVAGTYRDFTIYSMPPPSSGGVHLLQMLRLAENFPLRTWGQNSGQGTHILVEIMKRAYADRSEYLGDPDFVDVPVDELLSERYEQLVLGKINSMTPTASADISPGKLGRRSDTAPFSITIDPEKLPKESPQTTHFSIMDRHGNAVSNTYTLNLKFGSGIMVRGAGFLLNNEMDDFSAKPGSPNYFGLVGGEANAIAPRKRMLSSMTPTIVLKDDQVKIVTGSPGGSRIITTVLQVLLNVMEFDMNAAEATYAPRFHHQWKPDVLYLERGFPSDARTALRGLGYRFQTDGVIGAAQTIVRDGDRLTGACDPRRPGGAALGD